MAELTATIDLLCHQSSHNPCFSQGNVQLTAIPRMSRLHSSYPHPELCVVIYFMVGTSLCANASSFVSRLSSRAKTKV